MDTFTDNDELRPDDGVTSFDGTVSWFLIAVGIVLCFMLMITMFVQVNRVTTEPARDDRLPMRTDSPEIGRTTGAQTE